MNRINQLIVSIEHAAKRIRDARDDDMDRIAYSNNADVILECIRQLRELGIGKAEWEK